jgi:hypothetical protein
MPVQDAARLVLSKFHRWGAYPIEQSFFAKWQIVLSGIKADNGKHMF